MVMEETGSEVAGASENGTCVPEKSGEPEISNEDEEINGVKEMEEDSKEDEKAEDVKMDEDHELKEEKEMQEEGTKEDGGVDMEEENDRKEEEKAVEHKDEVVKVEEEKTVESKVRKDKAEEGKMEKKKVEESKEDQRSKKHGRRRSVVGGEEAASKKELGVKRASESTTPAPSIDRPVRERKSVERLVASVEREVVKEFRVEKGRGTPLMDIPNVAYKLARKKTEDSFKLLHTIIFGRRGKAFQIKNNISKFSGFVWHENEEKQKLKVKEKFDKYVKEKLLEFCDVLDIPVVKTTTRKEDIVMKLMDFLAAPHATTDVLLAEKEQSSKVRKRKRVVKRSASRSRDTSAKVLKRRKSEGTPKVKEKNSATETDEESEQEENEHGVPDESENELPEHSESEKKDEKEDESEDSEEDTGKRKRILKKSSKKDSSEKSKNKTPISPKKASAAASPKKTPSRSSSKSSKVDKSLDVSPRVFSRKKKVEETVSKKSTPIKTPTKEKTKEKSGKKVVKGKDKSKGEEFRPSEEELRNSICEILKKVDFNTATFTDILKQLARRYSMDLTPRKASLKLMIQEELTKQADEAEENEEDEDEDAEEDGGKEDNPVTATKEVEA